MARALVNAARRSEQVSADIEAIAKIELPSD